MLSRLQAVLALFKCYSAINVVDMVGAVYSMRR